MRASSLSRGQQALGLLVIGAVTYGTSAIGALASFEAASFYPELVRPDWAPPAWLFGPVWTVLYTLMAVSAWLVWRKDGLAPVRTAMAAFSAQLLVNGLWSWLFFAWRQGGLAFADIVLLVILIAWTMRLFAREHRAAAWMLAPYLAWVLFASALNLALWRMNPEILG